MPAVKGVGEPAAGQPHPRFMGAGEELLWQPIMAALGKTEGLEPGYAYGPSPASSLPDHPSPPNELVSSAP